MNQSTNESTNYTNFHEFKISANSRQRPARRGLIRKQKSNLDLFTAKRECNFRSVKP
jgi:hypothetical protein